MLSLLVVLLVLHLSIFKQLSDFHDPRPVNAISVLLTAVNLYKITQPNLRHSTHHIMHQDAVHRQCANADCAGSSMRQSLWKDIHHYLPNLWNFCGIVMSHHSIVVIYLQSWYQHCLQVVMHSLC